MCQPQRPQRYQLILFRTTPLQLCISDICVGVYSDQKSLVPHGKGKMEITLNLAFKVPVQTVSRRFLGTCAREFQLGFCIDFLENPRKSFWSVEFLTPWLVLRCSSIKHSYFILVFCTGVKFRNLFRHFQSGWWRPILISSHNVVPTCKRNSVDEILLCAGPFLKPV